MSRVNFKSTGWKHFIYRPGNPTPPTPDRVVVFRPLGMFSNFKYVSLLKFSEVIRVSETDNLRSYYGDGFFVVLDL